MDGVVILAVDVCSDWIAAGVLAYVLDDKVLVKLREVEPRSDSRLQSPAAYWTFCDHSTAPLYQTLQYTFPNVEQPH